MTASPLGPGIEALAFGKDGKLYAAQNATTGNFFTGAVFEVDPAAGTIVRTVASSITCASFLAADPFSGDLFVDDYQFNTAQSNELGDIPYRYRVGR